ncbi:glutaredoxin family protein [Brevibacillus gelatini]|uniref:Glutaredoxin family protein n=1 Tax=Brevibacillus gelatini TaxID=1655277 RepID=A0A3M8B7F6_9BACL|nr:glutaredoxin family protein [Brevibacillus gelatini]RNB59381.1 glutaredoxin family protein [Brevibacillus gelatini]
MKLLKFYKDNCPSCVLVTQFLDSKGVKYESINPFEQPQYAVHYGLMSVPVTILLDDNGEEAKRSVGFKPAELTEMINKLK